MTKQAKARRDGDIKPQNYNFHQFQHRNFRCSQNATNQPKSTVELGYVSSGTLWSTRSDTHQVVEIYKEASTNMSKLILFKKNHVFLHPRFYNGKLLIIHDNFYLLFATTAHRQIIFVSSSD